MIANTLGARSKRTRLLELIVAFGGVVLISATIGLAGTVRAADGATMADGAASAPKRAVIVVGPFAGDTANAIESANRVAAEATAMGMDVTTIYAPHATWGRVVKAANGADFFEYIGHGNGWPSPYRPFQENTKDGLGLNANDGDSDYSVKYYGANRIIASIHFAPNAIVYLNKLCYSSGNGEVGMLVPTQKVAVRRVDNFAAGFLAAGASVVFTLKTQPAEELIDALYQTHETMDDWFETTYDGGWGGDQASERGWIGTQPDLYFDSARTPGATIHIDPDSPVAGDPVTDAKGAYQRGVTGDLAFTTDAWLGSGH